VASDVRRKVRLARETVDELVMLRHPDPEPDPESQLGREQLRRCLDRILDEMAPEHRAVFVLAELEEMTMAEISCLLSIPQGTVASRLRRAREIFETRARALRARFEEETGS
jgi:RNA polymerase sigma-70 factor (ECF subfamily)